MKNLQLDPKKTEILQTVCDSSNTQITHFLGPYCHFITPQYRNLGVIFDSHLSCISLFNAIFFLFFFTVFYQYVSI